MKNKIISCFVCTLLITSVLTLLGTEYASAGSQGPLSTWELPITFGGGMYYEDLHAADVDGDGLDELLAGNWATNRVEVWDYNTITNTWSMMSYAQQPYNIRQITTGDYDEDGDIDIATAIRFLGIYVSFNTGGGGGWTTVQVHPQYGSMIVTTDLNGDGHLDLFTRQDPGRARIFYGNGDGTFIPDSNPIGLSSGVPNPNMPASGFYHLYPVDIDGDGDLDLYGSWVEGGWGWYPGDRMDFFVRGFINKGNDVTGKVIWGVSNAEVLGHYTGSIRPSIGYALDSRKSGSGDLNEDGYWDYVAYDNVGMSIKWMEGYKSADGKLNWTEHIIDSVPGYTHMRVTDINHDGHLDVIAGGFCGGPYFCYNGLRMYYGDGTGTFYLDSFNLDYGLNAGYMAVSDFNDDGYKDMALPRYTTNSDGFEIWIQSPPIIEITIDIKPGSYPNSINPKSKGEVPVAVLTTDEFDASTVNPDTVVFLSATPCKKEKLKDVDDDGDMDMLFHFKTQELDFSLLVDEGDEYLYAYLTGETIDGQLVEGKDTVRLIQHEQKHFETIFERLFERFSNLFPILRHLLLQR